MPEEKSITVYRAIWGRGKRGVSDEELRRNGMFTRNEWYEEQEHDSPLPPEWERSYKQHGVPLPVYLYRSQPFSAIVYDMGIKNGRFRPLGYLRWEKNTGVLAEAKIPFSLLFGPTAKLKLTKDHSRRALEIPEYEVTEEIADKLNSGELDNGGEFSLRPRGISMEEFKSMIRSLERLYRPRVDVEGNVISKKLGEIRLSPEFNEANIEVSKL